MNCVSQMVITAATEAKQKQRAEDERQQQAANSALVSNLKQQLVDRGVDPLVTELAVCQALEDLNLVLVPGSTPMPSGGSSLPSTKKPKVTQDRGTKVLEKPPFSMGHAPAEQKLLWIDQHADFANSGYTEASRQQLNRINPIAKCFRSCCNKDVAQFLAKHGSTTNKKDKDGNLVVNFVNTKFKPCASCKP